ncbi:MAG: hypothetical protein OEW31_10680 [Thermoleophilia bacterium]|nr:hypothetical protein [Thermoleophilia bacterium]MDH4346788.1 hypothetical protein [Thermoleophilia bacterium]MDH5333505.1 hypothetical protein [Thermoleophilia bacterium]
MSWLPPAGDGSEAAAGVDAWVPRDLAGGASADRRYVVVDEILGSVVGLAVSPWPSVDAEGRLRFRTGDVLTVAADRVELQGFLGEHRLPAELRERPLRIGDVFAVSVRPGVLEKLAGGAAAHARLEAPVAPAAWMLAPVHDISAEAREATKVAFYASVAPTMEPEEAALLTALEGAGED